MDLDSLQNIVTNALDDIKAQDVQVFNTTQITSLFDRVIVASGTSNTQTRALAKHVSDEVRTNGGHIISIEGGETGEWVLVDAADIVIHIMLPKIREYYNLEELWGGKSVHVSSEANQNPSAARPR